MRGEVDLPAARAWDLGVDAQNGGTEEEPSDGTLWARVINMFGTFDIVFSRGRIVAGVHQAESRELAESLAARLYSELPVE